jgi:hypothetical protein
MHRFTVQSVFAGALINNDYQNIIGIDSFYLLKIIVSIIFEPLKLKTKKTFRA